MVKLPILLSYGFAPIVKVNDQVKVGQIISSKVAPKEYIISVSKGLCVSTDKARKCLKKNPGDTVVIGDVLAVKKGFFGLNEDRIVSRVDGEVSRYERHNGNLVIQALPAGRQVGGEGDKGEACLPAGRDVVSPVDGIVVVCNNNMIVIGTEKDVYLGTKGVGESVIGEIFILEGGNDISLYYSLGSRAIGKIIVGGNFSRELLTKSIGMGVIGIIGTNINDADIEYLTSRAVALPIVEVESSVIEKILQWKDKRIYLNSPEKQILFLHV